MELLRLSSAIFFCVLLVGMPISLFRKVSVGRSTWSQLSRYLILGSLLSFIIIVCFAWWDQYTLRLLLGQYGYDFEAMNTLDRYRHVEAQDHTRVTDLQRRLLGIGWQLKAILFFACYSVYLIAVPLIGSIVLKRSIEE